MSCHLLLLHGWGLGAGMWRPLERALPECTCHALDLGFFGPAQLEIPKQPPFIAVGHSLGFLWLLQHLHEPVFQNHCLGLISINGFARFAHAVDFPHGVAGRILERMSRHLTTDPVALLTEFQRQSGLEKPLPIPASLNIPALTQGLTWLAQWDGREALAHWSKPVLAMATEEDRIVTPDLTCANFPATAITWLPTGGHLLPLSQTGACATRIARFHHALS